MKSLNSFAFTLGVVTLLAACGNKKQPAADTHSGHQHAIADSNNVATEKTTTSVTLKDDKLNAVYQHYIHLTTALVAGDLAEAKVAATAITLGAKQLTNGNALAVLATKIGEATDIEAQRTLLSDLSNDLIARVKGSGLSAGAIYVEYCPMALNDKGASWLSNQKDIKNPYFGDSMLTCGEVKETIK